MAEHELASIGKRLMVQVIDDLAKKDPQRKVCAVPKGSKIFGWVLRRDLSGACSCEGSGTKGSSSRLDYSGNSILGRYFWGVTALYPFYKTFEEVRDEIAFIARSSGTTELSMLVLIFQSLKGASRACLIDSAKTMLFWLQRHFFTTWVLFANHICLSWYLLRGSSGQPLSTEFLTSMLSATKPTAVFLPPCNLEDMTLSQASMEALWNLKYVFWGGSSLSPEVGRKIRDHTSLSGFMGMTEAGFILALAPEEKEDWEYFEWWPTNGIEMELVDENLYELVIHRHYDPFLHPVFHTFPDLGEYHTKDVYTRHPTKSELWKLRGRLDDVVSLSNGEKFNPVAIEKLIEGHALVARAVVVGNGRFQPALLVEPNWNQWGESSPAGDLIAHIWSTVQEANRINPAHGRIMENKIGLASKIKPFQTTPKGSTQRRLVTRDYEKEIEAIYTYQDDDTIRYQMPKSADMSGIKEFVRNVVSDTLGFSSFSKQTDFYNLGLDSLQTMQLSWILHVHAGREDFNISVDSFEDVHIRGTRHIIEFSLQSEHNAHIYFMSSIGTIGEWKPTHGPSIPEMPLEDCDVTLRQGYTNDHITLGTNCRPTSRKRHMESAGMVTTSCCHIEGYGKIPRTLGSMSVEWIPVDTLATVITELIHTRSTIRADSRCSVFHLVNPLATSWESLLPSVQERYNVQPVEVSEWVNELEKVREYYTPITG
ncbi:hypothetical protein ETB97_001592 [Aspergillus alliaceus]|uniref:Carrier domain-containing protein n=1 Tax=Petromyces alliaceus TaxID=209559 RepID=A0A8H6E6Y8_PETAA|nr:hypothetical protein ETB97_001592 [Aspergillus burnettii]